MYLCVCVWVHIGKFSYLWQSEEGTGCSGGGSTGEVRTMARMLGTKLGSSERAEHIPTTELPLQPSEYFFGAGDF